MGQARDKTGRAGQHRQTNPNRAAKNPKSNRQAKGQTGKNRFKNTGHRKTDKEKPEARG